MERDLKNKDNSLKIFGIVFSAGVLSRLLILLIGVMILKLTGTNMNLIDFFNKTGDAPHYIDIAQNGYVATGETANNIVFYPLFPYLMKFLTLIFREYAISGVFISCVTFGLSAVYLYKLMRLDYSEEKTVDALLLLFIAPYGMFFLSTHTESLFLMLSVMALYYSREENWIAASIAGFFAALTKTQGMVLFVPVVYEAILCCIRDKKFHKKTLFSILILVGFLIYLCINKVVQGDWFAYVEHQAAAPWYNSAKWISDSLSTSYGVGIEHFGLSMILYWPQIVIFFAAVAFVFVGLYKGVRTSYLAFMGIYTLVTYFHGWMLSGARYITSCIVMYVVMASIDNKIFKYLAYLISGGMCIGLFVMWLCGFAIM